MMGWEVLWLVTIVLFISGKNVYQRRLEQHHVPLRCKRAFALQTRGNISLWSLAY